jgi:hypothetical protein
VLPPGGTARAELRLGGSTLDEALGWLVTMLDNGARFARPSYEMPAHAVASGGVFGSDGRAARLELARWYATAAATLHRIVAATPGASPVRCWPHHFDIATLLRGPREGSTLGVGLSPGDGSYALPYWYVTPWPYPDPRALPPLASGGHWHRAGWFGAVLTGDAALAPATPAARAQALLDFLEAAVPACQEMLARA